MEKYIQKRERKRENRKIVESQRVEGKEREGRETRLPKYGCRWPCGEAIKTKKYGKTRERLRKGRLKMF